MLVVNRELPAPRDVASPNLGLYGFVSKGRFIETVAVGLLYYGAARIGLAMHLPGTNASAVWPPSGIAIAATLLLGRHIWPAIAAGAFFANLLTLPQTPGGFVAAALIAVGNAAAQIVALAIIQRACPSGNPFERARDSLWFVAASAIAALIAAANGATVLRMTSMLAPEIYKSALLTWWVGDMAGMVILGPALHAWGRDPRLRLGRDRAVEFGILVVLMLVVVRYLFVGASELQLAPFRPHLPLLLWAAFRFGQRETSTLAAIASVEAVFYTWSAMQTADTPATASVMATLFGGFYAMPFDWLRSLQLFLCGNSVVAILVAAAVAERDESQRAVRDSERRYRRIFHSSAVSLWEEDFTAVGEAIDSVRAEGVQDLESYCRQHPEFVDRCIQLVRIVDVNDASLQLFGARNKSELLAGLQTIFQPQTRDVFAGQLVAISRGQPRFEAEAVLRTVDGERRDSLVSVALPPSGGSLEGVLVSVTDITSRKRAEQALQDSEHRFRTIFEQAAVGVALIQTSTGRFLRINQRYCDIVGYSVQEMTALTFHSITHPDDLPRDLHHMQRLIAGETTQFAMEKRYRRRDGSIVWVNLTVSSTWNRGQRADHHIAVVEDITTRKQAETALRSWNQTLEARVEERTLQLRESLEEKETLLREIHHRVKNNLAVVSSLLYLAAARSDDGRAAHVLRESQDRVRSMALVHEELYRSGNLGAISFSDYVSRLLHYVLQSYGGGSPRIRTRLEIREVQLDADSAVPCGLILTELFTNALKHAFPDGRSGTIAVTLQNSDDGCHRLLVSDDGVGIAPGVEIDTAPTLGWRLVRSLTRQLDGTFTIRRTASGTEAALLFPAKTIQVS